MKEFIAKVFIFLLLLFTLHVVAAFVAGPKLDDFYNKIASSKKTNLIIGTSRASQGILPTIMEAELNKRFFNFAFTNAHSPFGPIYEDAILRKLDTQTLNQSFIICVQPWSLSFKNSNKDEPLYFRENGAMLSNMRFINWRPNFEYLYRWYYKGWGRIILNESFPSDSATYVHNDGWMEISVPMDSISVKKRIQAKMKLYEEYIGKYSLSEVRMSSLKRLIIELSKYGDITLVRIPVCEEMLGYEESIVPEFDEIITQMSHEYSFQYLSFSNDSERFMYTDGNHLHKASAAEFTRIISRKIKAFQ